jgi:hypothetical protein
MTPIELPKPDDIATVRDPKLQSHGYGDHRLRFPRGEDGWIDVHGVRYCTDCDYRDSEPLIERRVGE